MTPLVPPDDPWKDPIAFALLKLEVKHLTEKVEELKESLERRDEEMRATMQRLVTQTEFWPIKQSVYGLIGGVMLAAIGALMASVLKQ
jgi:hypothetical protein